MTEIQSLKPSHRTERIPAVRQSGLTLIEVLIALVVLAVGLIGIAVMHLNALRFAHSSYYSSVASSVALDLEERLWLQVAQSGGQCLSDEQVNGLIDVMNNRWSGTDTARVVIPGLEIGADRIEVDANDQWTEVAITMTWSDNRFGNDLVESYSYAARTICNQAPPPPPGP